MSQLVEIFDFLADCIKEYLLMMNSNWLTQCILFVVVLGFVVSAIVVMRGK